jgi:hypothetical protein
MSYKIKSLFTNCMKEILLLLSFFFGIIPMFSQNIKLVQFNNDVEVSGQKFAIKDINPNMPRNWDGFKYVVLEYKISTAQRFQLGFTTADGYNELRIMSYVPNAWNRLAIPLKFFTDLPDPAADLAATNNHARYTGWINLGGKRGPLHQVDSIGFRMRKAINHPKLEISDIYLSYNDPDDLYMGDKPAVDEFGQSNLVEYDGKAHSLADIKRDWNYEDNEKVSTAVFNYSKYGGYKQKRVKGTGFFYTTKVGERWWFVDPDGYLFLSVGVDCVSIDNGGSLRDYNHRANMYKEVPPKDILTNNQDFHSYVGGKDRCSFGIWNLYRRYGVDYKQKAVDMIIKRMDKWGINTIANWSSEDVTNVHKKAYTHQLRLDFDPSLMGLCDIYKPGFKEELNKSLQRQVSKYKDDPWLLGYFIGNEPAWLNEEVRLCDIILSGNERPIKTALKSYLLQHGNTEYSKKNFIYVTFHDFLQAINQTLKQYDSNHLSLGIRFGDPKSLPVEVLKICGEMFDVFSFNCYELVPSVDMLERVKNTIDLPIIIGEYHFGTVDRGYAQSLWQVDNEEQRGVAYRYYTENAYAHPSLIGTGYFQWSDEDLTGRSDGENYNCGLIDVTDRPYKEQVSAMTETAKRLYNIHSGKLKPFNEKPMNCRGHGSIPDLWNK